MGSSSAGIRTSGGEVCVNLQVIACLGHVWRQEAVQSLLAARGDQRVDGELACAGVFHGVVVHAFKLDR